MNESMLRNLMQFKFANYLPQMQEELQYSVNPNPGSKDILLVVKDQLSYVKNCVNSLYEHTENFFLYIWDNGSEEETKVYLEALAKEKSNVTLVRSETNQGFILPNNHLASISQSDYLIALNTDTEVKKGWDNLMLNWLEQHPDVGAVGFSGSRLDENFKGGPIHFGYEIDYLPGWALMISRKTYEKFGLFDEKNLNFIYGEDADFCLRLKEAGLKLYAFHVDLILHYENKTVVAVNQEPVFHEKFKQSFEENHVYLKKRWGGKGLIYREQTL